MSRRANRRQTVCHAIPELPAVTQGITAGINGPNRKDVGVTGNDNLPTGQRQ